MTGEVHHIRVVIADENPLVLRTLRQSLESAPDVCVLGEASSPEDIVRMAGTKRPDILLVELALAQKTDFRAFNARTSAPLPIRIVVTLPSVEQIYLLDAFRLGAHGAVRKRPTPHQLLESLRSVIRGQYWIESESLGILIEALRESLAVVNGPKTLKDYGLTRREVDIISKIASGQSNKQVSEEFAISERTVKHHLTNIFDKVGVSNRLQLALFAVNQRLTNDSAQLFSRERRFENE